MGLDGGTYITRSDVLRGASWALSTADTSRSSRGGNVQAGTVFKRRRLDPRADKCVLKARIGRTALRCVCLPRPVQRIQGLCTSSSAVALSNISTLFGLH